MTLACCRNRRPACLPAAAGVLDMYPPVQPTTSAIDLLVGVAGLQR
jgi:hypothetical protein